jgi:1-acyl-sn-glycerol-3-phosphate acyltransferase
MFASDLESTKNCMRVLAEGRVLAMMPEARLSTVGVFEDIQSNTYSFLKKSAVPIYTICFKGDYFANPKWGNGCRRGAVVEAELDLLLSAEQVKEMSAEQIGNAVEEKLYYNEFEWLESRPEIRYKNRKLAEGLENILSICPKCQKSHTIVTKGKKIYCEECGYLTELDERYQFVNEFCFKNFAEWYNWQKAEIAKKIDQDENFSLSSPVTLRHSDQTGKNLTRHAGEGVCTLTIEGLRYVGTRDGEECDILFPLSKIYRLLFGAGENFEVYQGSEIFYFVPKEKRSAVDWYITSKILYDKEF